MGQFRDTMLHSNFTQASVADQFNELFVHKIEEIRSSIDPDSQSPLTLLTSPGQSLQRFNLQITAVGKSPVLQEISHKKVL